MSAHACTEDQLVEQPTIGLFAELGWTTVSALRRRKYSGGSSEASAGRSTALLPPVNPRFSGEPRTSAHAPQPCSATARGSATGLDLRRFLANRDIPRTNLALRWSSDVAGDSLADLRGDASLRIDRSLVDSVRVYGGDVRLRFLSGTMAVDSLHLESAAFSVLAHGRLALAPGRAGDSVAFRVSLDSLGGFRRALARLTTAPAAREGAAAPPAADTSALDGVLRVDGAIGGAWPGNPNQATAFPQYHDIDYVRVYDQKPADGTRIVSTVGISSMRMTL